MRYERGVQNAGVVQRERNCSRAVIAGGGKRTVATAQQKRFLTNCVYCPNGRSDAKGRIRRRIRNTLAKDRIVTPDGGISRSGRCTQQIGCMGLFAERRGRRNLILRSIRRCLLASAGQSRRNDLVSRSRQERTRNSARSDHKRFHWQAAQDDILSPSSCRRISHASDNCRIPNNPMESFRNASWKLEDLFLTVFRPVG